LSVNLTAVWGGATPNVTTSLLSPQFYAYQLNGTFRPRANALYLYQAESRKNLPIQKPWTANATLDAPGSTTLNWTFGDGTTGSGTPVAHSWAQAAGYTVNLYAKDSWGDTARGVLGVLVGSATTPPLSVLGGPSRETGAAPLVVSFAANATGGVLPYSFSWSTGDGGTSAAENFSYTYQSVGNFTASLLVFDNYGHRYVMNWTIAVLNGGSGNSTPPAAIPPLVLYVILGGVIAAILVAAALLVSGRRRRPPPTPLPHPAVSTVPPGG
jgi:chitodextrinase